MLIDPFELFPTDPVPPLLDNEPEAEAALLLSVDTDAALLSIEADDEVVALSVD